MEHTLGLATYHEMNLRHRFPSPAALGTTGGEVAPGSSAQVVRAHWPAPFTLSIEPDAPYNEPVGSRPDSIQNNHGDKSVGPHRNPNCAVLTHVRQQRAFDVPRVISIDAEILGEHRSPRITLFAPQFLLVGAVQRYVKNTILVNSRWKDRTHVLRKPPTYKKHVASVIIIRFV